MKKIIQFLFPALLLCCWSCSEGEDSLSTQYPIIESGKYVLNLEAVGGQTTLTITTKSTWTASVSPNEKWVKVFPTNGGKGTHTLTVTAQPNEEIEARKATLSIESGNTETVTVNQKGAKETMLLTEHEYTVENTGDTLTVELKSNIKYEIIWPDVDWISEVSGRAMSSYTHYIGVSPNKTLHDRHAQIIFRSKVSDLADTLKIIQLRKEKADYSNPQNEREALEALYRATNGTEWTNDDNWGSDRPLNEWYGISTDSHGLVENISLSGNNLTGYIPEEIGYFQNLRHLDLSYNPIEGKLPDALFTLSNLGHIGLASTKCTGNMSQICQLTNLSYILLYGSSITGPIPEEIKNLKNLWFLGLQGSPIGGSIPASIGELPNLQHMYIAHCQLEGRIPESIGNMPELITIGFDNNNLTGNIPGEMFNAPKLEYIDLSNNQLEGNIPDEIANLENVWFLGTHSNSNLTDLPQATSLLQLPCWQYSWWVMIHDTGIKAPIEEQLIPGPSFEVIDFEGNTIVSNEEYSKNKYTVLIQWDPTQEKSKKIIPTVVSLYKAYANKGLGIIGWCREAQDKMEQIEDYISKEQITWRNFNSSGDNNIYRVYSEYPIGEGGFTLHVVNSDNRVVFSSLVTDVNTLPDFLEEAFGE